MPILADRLNAEAMSVEFVGDSIRVALTDGREISAPLEWFPACATPLTRNASSGA